MSYANIRTDLWNIHGGFAVDSRRLRRLRGGFAAASLRLRSGIAASQRLRGASRCIAVALRRITPDSH